MIKVFALTFHVQAMLIFTCSLTIFPSTFSFLLAIIHLQKIRQEQNLCALKTCISPKITKREHSIISALALYIDSRPATLYYHGESVFCWMLWYGMARGLKIYSMFCVYQKKAWLKISKFGHDLLSSFIRFDKTGEGGNRSDNPIFTTATWDE